TDYKNWREYVWESKKILTPMDILYTLRKYSLLPLYKAGKEFNYSNTNYVLLTLIIEQITGKTIGDFLKEKVFLPYGLQNTAYTTSFSTTGYYFSSDSNSYINYQTPKNIYDLDIERSVGTVVSSIEDINRWMEICSSIEALNYENINLDSIKFDQVFPLKSTKDSETYFWTSTTLGENIRILWDTEQAIRLIEASNIISTYTRNDSAFLGLSVQISQKSTNALFPSISLAERIKQKPNQYNESIELFEKPEFKLESTEILKICSEISQNNPELSIKILNKYFQNDFSSDYYYALAESYLANEDTVQAINYLNDIIEKDSLFFKAKILKNNIDPDFNWDSYYTKNQITADIEYLHSALIKFHPGLYDYLGKEKLDSLISAQIEMVTDSVNYYDFFKILSAIFPQVKDNHTDFGGSPRHSNELLKEHVFIPLDVVLINDNLYVTKDCSTTGEISAGAKILGINGKNISDIIKEINDVLPSDGNNLTYKAQFFKSFFKGLYLQAIENPSKYSIDYIPYNEEHSKEVQLLALSNDSINSIRTTRYTNYNTDEKLLSYKQINDKTGLLTIKSFNIYWIKNNGQNFNHFLDSSFAQIKADNIENLIIDLRDNGGGRTPFGMLLYSYLTDKPFTYIDSTFVNRFWDYNYSDNFLRIPRIEYDKRSYVQLDNESYLVNTYPLQYCNVVPENNFKGKVYILINGGSISCTGLFCSIARKNDRATFIGEESGSAYGGFSADPFVILLPNTLFKVLISGMKFQITANGDLSRGVIPDYQVQPSIEDILKNRDIELEYTLDLISKEEND
ncbi:MAG: S41 family peptidase, partial [Cyclobacteriaceae bacterium]